MHAENPWLRSNINQEAGTFSALVAPSLGLASCVRSYVMRSTMDAELRPEQRYNHFPASPLCGIFWLLEGESRVVRRGESWVDEPVPRVSFAGPHTMPVISVNPGPVRAFMLGLLPQAFQALTGLNLANWVNRIAPLNEVFDDSWKSMAQRVLEAPDDNSRIHHIESFLEPRWHDLRGLVVSRPERYRYWAEALALKAGTTGVGTSLRQTERRIKQWAGLSLRDLRRLGRAEQSFFLVRDSLPQGEAQNVEASPNWAAIALDSGYADQSHLCREVRRVAGMSPAELQRAIEEDEGFWTYRIWS